MITRQRVSARRSVVAVEGGPTFLRGETLGDAARRHGMRRDAMGGLLRAAGVQPGAGRRYDPATVNAAVEARHQVCARAELAPHQPDADGNVACGPCWAIATVTGGRVTRCRWCSPATGWGG